MKALAEEVKQLEQRVREIEAKMSDISSHIPNMTHPDAPIGREEDFVTRDICGTIPSFHLIHLTMKRCLPVWI